MSTEIEEGVDLALRVRSNIEDSATLVAKTLGTSRAVVVASPDLLSRQKTVHTPEDLSQLETVAMSISDGRSSWQLEGPNGQTYTHRHTPRFIADDLHMLVCAAVRGNGAAILPEYVCRSELQSGSLIRVLPDWEPPPGIMHAVFPARRTMVPAVRRMVDFLEEILAGYGSCEYGG